MNDKIFITPYIQVVILATYSITTLGNYDNLDNEYFQNRNKTNYINENNNDFFRDSSSYNLLEDDVSNVDNLFNFAKILISKSKDIDSKIVDIINDNFWELI